ncbi:MAG: FAD-dependent oxidoreductase [Thermoguttaceae bacterium]|jgi:pyruvate/2-oxoglutarate dehydrogenase complex dihydrolipoamide dehydrogenase (E3) component|nr:FAD-dependent oxidoreductase [Thermoguttaceae bacterium]
MIDPIGHSRSYALVVLGEGVAAVAAAREAARRGRRVALLLPEEPAPNPTQLSNFARTIRECQAKLGLVPPPPPVDEPRIDIFRGPLRFSRYRTVSVGGIEVRFRRAIVATGSRPGPVALAGADAAGPLYPHKLDRLTAPPGRLAVIGSDGAACFWAQQLQRLGSEVHLVASGPRLLETSDELAARIVVGQLQAEGVAVYDGCEEVVLDRTGNRRGVLIRRDGQREKVLVDEVLVCTVPQPNLAQLSLETAAVSYGERGIGVDDWLRTSERSIFAAGGACGSEFASPEAEEATGRLAARNALAWVPRRLSRCVIPRCTPTDPPVVELGFRPGRAAATGPPGDRRCVEFRESVPNQSHAPREGCVIVHVDHRGRLLGATVAAVGAEELAVPLMLLMQRRWPLRALGELTTCHSGRARLLAALAQK